MSSKIRGKRSTAREATAAADGTIRQPQNLAEAGDPRRARALETIGGLLDEAEAGLAGRFASRRQSVEAISETAGSTGLAEAIRGNTKLIARVDAVRQELAQQAREIDEDEKSLRDAVAEVRAAMGKKRRRAVRS